MNIKTTGCQSSKNIVKIGLFNGTKQEFPLWVANLYIYLITIYVIQDQSIIKKKQKEKENKKSEKASPLEFLIDLW